MSVSYNVPRVFVGRQYRTLLYEACVSASVRVAEPSLACMGPTNGSGAMFA